MLGRGLKDCTSHIWAFLVSSRLENLFELAQDLKPLSWDKDLHKNTHAHTYTHMHTNCDIHTSLDQPKQVGLTELDRFWQLVKTADCCGSKNLGRFSSSHCIVCELFSYRETDGVCLSLELQWGRWWRTISVSVHAWFPALQTELEEGQTSLATHLLCSRP